MTHIYTLNQIKTIIKPEEAIKAIEEGFLLYSQNKAVIAPLSQLEIEKSGIAKVKYGYIKNKEFYVMKIASFFPENKKHNLPAVNASMQIYNQKTGAFEALLLDEGYLTNIRTAAAGAVCVKHLTQKQVKQIGIIGTGVQARLQLEYLQYATNCKAVMVWGKNLTGAQKYKREMEKQGFVITIAESIADLAKKSDLIITTTYATEPVLFADHVNQGTLVISVGADTKTKQELDASLLKLADIVIADSKIQCKELGNISHALQRHTISEDKIVELGDIVSGKIKVENKNPIIIVNLTGVAVQDIQIANLAYQKLLTQGGKK